MNGSTAVKRSTMVVRVGSGSTADLADLHTIGSTEIIVNRSLNPNVSIQTFASGATGIEIKDYYGSKTEICDHGVQLDDASAQQSFGKRTGRSSRRSKDCMVLEPSEMIVIDYPDVQHIPVAIHQAEQNVLSAREARRGVQSMNLDHVVMSNGRYPTSSNFAAAATPTSSNGSTPTSTLRRATHTSSSSASSIATCAMAASTSGAAVSVPKGLPRSYETNDFTRLPLDVDSMACSQRSDVYLNGVGVEDDDDASPSSSTASASNSHIQQQAKVKHRPSKSSSSSDTRERLRVKSTASSTTTEGDDVLAGLPEATVDSEDEDEESCPSHDSFHELKDNVRECLEKEPHERTEDDLSILLDFMQHMPALSNLPMSVKRELCLKMVFAVVPESGSIVMNDNEPFDSWSVIVNGQVEVTRPDGQRILYSLGDSFGVEPVPDIQFHRGTMRTIVDDCEFVLVEHKDYCSIMSKVHEHIEKHADKITGEIVSETEKRTVDNHHGFVLIKGKADKLISHLVEERDTAVDPHYVDDLLLMYRVFIQDPVMIFEKLAHWFGEQSLRDKVARIVLLWVNNHFNDFETNVDMMKLLERFEQALERENMQSQQALLNIACSVKSRTRTVTYTRSNRDEVLHFSILGGPPGVYGIFVSKVEEGSQAEKVGLKRGDEILEVNGQNFQHVTHQRALELLRSSTHLSITVKSNLLGFKEMLSAPDKADQLPPDAAGKKPSGKFAKNKTTSQLIANGQGGRGSVPSMGGPRQTTSCAQLANAAKLNGVGRHGSPGRDRVFPTAPPGSIQQHQDKTATRSMMDRLLTKLKGSNAFFAEDEQALDQQRQHRPPTQLRPSRSNPDITGHGVLPNIAQYYQPVKSACPEHVLKIYRSDQSFKYLTVYKETTAQNVVQLSLQEFGMSTDGGSLEWALCETTVTPEGVIKQRRLPDQMQNLAERIALNSRYYLKNNNRSDPLVPDELAPEILKEAQTQLLQLNAQILAAQMTLQDFAVYSSIEPTEYVDNLFRLDSRYGWPKLQEFEEIVNREMWWVATEICREKAVFKRVKLIKKFIKIARHCRDFRNFNSMFAIMSGLDKPAVRRLHHTWEKIPNKYTKMLDDVQQLLDPSRNMSKYRQHLAQVSQDPPVVPLFPVIKKDLTFIHEGNPTYSDGLVNFEKLRMIAKEIRSAAKMASAPYELNAMAEQSSGSGGGLSDALLHMNNFDNGGNNAVATMRKLATQKAPQPRKKMYEQALMVRKVKSYLGNLDVIDNESELDRLSLECEAQPLNGFAGSANPGRKRLPSPSPSSVSSHSNTSDQRRIGPKFEGDRSFIGVESPQAVQKMLSLVQNSRVKPAAHPPPYQRLSSAPMVDCSSPVQSPHASRRSHPTHRIQRVPSLHGRSQSETVVPSLPVDLSAESSSVTNFLTPGLRISSTGSVTSTDSVMSEHHSQSSGKLQSAITHAVSCDSTDSGHASMAEAVGGSNGENNSPMAQRRSLPPNQLSAEQLASASTQQQRQRLAASATHMLHRPNPAFAFAQPPPTGPRHLKGRAPLPPPPPPPVPPHPPKSYASVQIGRRPMTNSMGPIDENGSCGNEQVSRV